MELQTYAREFMISRICALLRIRGLAPARIVRLRARMNRARLARLGRIEQSLLSAYDL